MNGNWWGRDDELELERVANEEGPRKARSRIPRCLIPKRSNFYQNRFGHFLAKFGQTQTLNRPSKTDFFVSLSFLFPTQRPLLASWRRHYNGRRYVMYPPITMCLLHPIGLEAWGMRAVDFFGLLRTLFKYGIGPGYFLQLSFESLTQKAQGALEIFRVLLRPMMP